MLPNNVLQCHDASDVYLVLNASSHIVHDMEHAYEETGSGKQRILLSSWILRQWTGEPGAGFSICVSSPYNWSHNQRLITMIILQIWNRSYACRYTSFSQPFSCPRGNYLGKLRFGRVLAASI